MYRLCLASAQALLLRQEPLLLVQLPRRLPELLVPVRLQPAQLLLARLRLQSS